MRLVKPSLRHLLIACCITVCAVSTLGAQAFLCAGHVPNGPLSAAKIAVDERLPVLSTKGRIGPIYILTVFARFADEEPTPVPEWADQLFALEREGSFAHFYHTMSFGQLAIAGEVLPRRFAASQPASAYLADAPGQRGRYGNFAHEILAQVDAQVDLARFDNDGPDGMHYRRLAVGTNPSTLETPTLSEVTTGLALENMRMDGDGLTLDVVMPRWGGVLREEVHWAGEVLIDGDLTIAPEGRLVVFRNTQIRVAGSDRLQMGLDPERTEIHVHGDFVIRSAAVSQIANTLHVHPDTTRFCPISRIPSTQRQKLPIACRGRHWCG